VSEAPEIKPKSRWIYCKTDRTARVLGEAEGWIVARWKGCMPSVRHRNDWHQNLAPAPMQGKTSAPAREVAALETLKGREKMKETRTC